MHRPAESTLIAVDGPRSIEDAFGAVVVDAKVHRLRGDIPGESSGNDPGRRDSQHDFSRQKKNPFPGKAPREGNLTLSRDYRIGEVEGLVEKVLFDECSGTSNPSLTPT